MDREIRDRERDIREPQRVFATEAPSREMSKVELTEDIFTYHPPRPGQEEKYAAIRAAGKSMAMVILATCPQCADRTDAIRKVREAVMTANASIALNGAV